MNRINLKSLPIYVLSGGKWILFSILVGIIGGVAGSLFHYCIDFATEIRQHFWWLIMLLPLGGIIIAVSYKAFLRYGNMDTNRVIESVNGERDIPLIMTPLIFMGTVITHLFGGSAGREGAALQLGGSLGYNTGKLFRLDEFDKRTMVMIGMSAVFAALFGTPLTAAVFAIEVSSVGDMKYQAFLPGMIAATVAYFIAKYGFGIMPTIFVLPFKSDYDISLLLKVVLFALLCALLSILFCSAIKYAEKGMKKFFPNTYLRSVVGGLVIVLLTFAVGTDDYNGAGMDVIKNAVSGNARYEAFVLKIIFTAITIAAGFKGGEIVPTFFIGATFGCVAGGFLGMPPELGAAIGIIAMFCGVTNCPVASILLAVELFNGKCVLLFALAIVVSFVFSGYCGLYNSQRFAVHKIPNFKFN